MPDLSLVKTREKLKAKREPHWQKLGTGQFIGYRVPAGTWIARHYDAVAIKYVSHSLGDFSTLPPNERYGAAVKAAREWLDHLARGGSKEVLTVRDACERYAEGKPDATKRFPRYVYNDPIASIQLQKLTDRHVRAWRKRLEATPAEVSKNKKGPRVTRPRSAATVNRDMVPFRAALNMALDSGDVLTGNAWKKALEPAEANQRRELYLNKEQRKRLLDALTGDTATLARALCLLPVRPGALADADVSHYDSPLGVLSIAADKAGAGRKLPLSQGMKTMLDSLCRNKLPNAPLFMRDDGTRWNKDKWKKPFKQAAETAHLPKETSAYTLRHSVITDLVSSGLDLFTVAQLAGTSVRMIEKHYDHLQQHLAAKALETLAI